MLTVGVYGLNVWKLYYYGRGVGGRKRKNRIYALIAQKTQKLVSGKINKVVFPDILLTLYVSTWDSNGKKVLREVGQRSKKKTPFLYKTF